MSFLDSGVTIVVDQNNHSVLHAGRAYMYTVQITLSETLIC